MNFAPHVRIPTLMMSGRYDFMDPLDTCQEPLFRSLGTPPQEQAPYCFRFRTCGARCSQDEGIARLAGSLSRSGKVIPPSSQNFAIA